MARVDYCFACGKDNPIGLHLNFQFEGDKYIARKTITNEYQSYLGVVHGGIVTTLLDEAMANYIIDKYHEPQPLTGRLSIRYKNPTPIGQELIIEAWQEEQRRNIYTMRSSISTVDGTITAEATAKMAVVKN